MGDVSEMRGLIVLFSVVSLTVSLVILMPPEFMTGTDAGVNTGIDPKTLDLLAWNSSLTLNLTDAAEADFTLNGYSFHWNTFSDHFLHFQTYSSWWIFRWNIDQFSFFDGNGTDVTELTTVILEFKVLNLTGRQNAEEFTIKNSKTSANIVLAFNNTAYADAEAALNAHALSVVFMLDWNDRNTSMNAFSLVSMVLTGRLPNIDPVLNGLFAFIGWGFVAAAAYLAFIFALRIVGAVFGGGGA